MKKFALAFLFTFSFLMTARAELVAVWNFDGTTGLEKTAGTDSSGFWTGLTDGTLNVADTTGTYATRVYDEKRQSYVWQFTPSAANKGANISLGSIPTLGNDPTSTEMASDFTYSLWVKVGSAYSSGYGNSIIIGDRNSSSDTQEHNFFKVMTGSAQYYNYKNGGGSIGVSTGLSTNADEWQFFTITKAGNKLTTYVNGVQNASGTIPNAALNSVALKIGGNSATNEAWPGSIDQVAVHNSALTTAQIQEAYRISLSEPMAAKRAAQQAASNGKITNLSDFNTTSQTLTKGQTWTQGDGAITWNVKEMGLENRAGAYTSNIEASIVGASDYGTTNSLLKINGTFGDSTSAHWSGAALQSAGTYNATPENPLIFSVDRVLMDNSNRDARSAIWLFKDTSHYVHFAQNTEGGNRWSYNVDGGTNQGFSFGNTDDKGFHNMTMKYDGTNIWMYADGKLVGTATSTMGSDVSLIINGQSWGTNDTNGVGYVNVLFDSAQLIRPGAPQTEVPIVCDFSDGSLEGWNKTGSGSAFTQKTETNYSVAPATSTVKNLGLLGITGAADVQWPTKYALDGLQVAVVRDSMNFSSPNTEGGLKLTALDGQEYITVSQRDDGNWTLAWEGLTVTGLAKDGTPIAFSGNSADLYLGDYFQTQMLMSAEATDSGTDFTLKLDSNEYTFSTDWDPNGVVASLFAAGTNAYVGFDNFAITGSEVPEPAAWALALLLFAGLGLLRRK
ncbi:MAG: LamG domain-containing protein [Thermoguttaceae bacterium]|nr:LamG domain-containing protein [Thermoguttaceae bacterium]